MNTDLQGKRRFGVTAIGLLLAIVGWLPAVAAKIDRYCRGPGEYMFLDMLLPMIWLGGSSLVGIGISAYAIWQADKRGHSVDFPLIVTLLNGFGIFVSVIWFF